MMEQQVTPRIENITPNTGRIEMGSLWILEKNTYYALKITSGSNQVARLVSGFNWMEL